MTESPPTPEAGIADALGQLSDQTAVLVRREIEAARLEMWERMKQIAPTAGLLGGAGVLGVLAVASSYRFTITILRKVLPPSTAALFATMGYGTAAGYAAVAGWKRLRETPMPYPVDTSRRVGQVVKEATTDGNR